MPPKKESIKTMEAINRFVRDNPRTEKAGGGILVQPGFGGTRQGYKGKNQHSDMTEKVNKFLKGKKEIKDSVLRKLKEIGYKNLFNK